LKIQVPVLVNVNPILFVRAMPILVLVLSACATSPPVQEMSDARQAIAAARDAGAETYAPQRLRDAESSLAMAESYLQDGISSSYWSAKQSALKAKETAFDALLKSRAAQEQPGDSAQQ